MQRALDIHVDGRQIHDRGGDHDGRLLLVDVDVEIREELPPACDQRRTPRGYGRVPHVPALFRGAVAGDEQGAIGAGDEQLVLELPSPVRPGIASLDHAGQIRRPQLVLEQDVAGHGHAVEAREERHAVDIVRARHRIQVVADERLRMGPERRLCAVPGIESSLRPAVDLRPDASRLFAQQGCARFVLALAHHGGRLAGGAYTRVGA